MALYYGPMDARPPAVRTALPTEAPAIAALQLACLETDPALEGFTESLTLDEMAAAWTEAIGSPPLASYRVLVATDGPTGTIVGFAVTGPSDDEDAEPTTGLIGEFIISSDHRGLGHGTRLLQACVDTLRADGFTVATWWLTSTDDARRRFITSTGWATDGAHRELGAEDASDASIRQVRLHTAID